MTASAYPQALPALTQSERLELFAVYLTVQGLHHLDFDAALADPAIRICLRNTAEAIRRRKAKLAQQAARFELTP